eukprot:scaffold2358_cov160-Amphora_coffeaeformis.AAC.5
MNDTSTSPRNCRGRPACDEPNTPQRFPAMIPVTLYDVTSTRSLLLLAAAFHGGGPSHQKNPAPKT